VVEEGAAICWASQQKVSLVHSCQLRFSSRFPCATEFEHFAKTANYIYWLATRGGGKRGTEGVGDPPVHMLNKFSGVVSTLWMTLASTCKTGVSSIEGILGGVLPSESSRT
jgi:hypothetical protein